MHDDKAHKTDENLLEELGYEPTDVDVARMPSGGFWFFAISTVFMILGFLFMAGIAPNMIGRPDPTTFERRRTPAAPNPILQTNVTAHGDMVKLRKAEKEATTTYAWTDRKNGRVRVQVESAMALVEQEGLPTRPGAKVPEDYDK
jgi:hypothetical protein